MLSIKATLLKLEPESAYDGFGAESNRIKRKSPRKRTLEQKKRLGILDSMGPLTE